MTMTITEPERATSHHHHHHHHRTSGSELFVCFTSRASSSSSSASMMKLASSSSSSAKASILSPGRSDKLREAPASRRLKASGSIKGQSSPMLFATGKKRNGSGFETQEPTSPKVTCIGQVRVKTKQGKKKMRVGRGGEASFSKREHHQHEDCLPHRTQRWSHIFCFKKEISFSICEAIREFACFLPCTSGGDGGGHGERPSAASPAAVKDDGKERDGVSTACGAVFAKWLMVLQDGDEKRLREEVPLRGNGGRAPSAAQAVVLLQHEEEEIRGKCTRAEEEMGEEMEACLKEINKEEKVEEEEEEEKIVVPPKNALLLMRCRSDPVRMAALASRFWESPVVVRPHEEDEEEDEDEDEDDEEDFEDVVEERKDDEVEGMLDRMEGEDEVMILEEEEREMDEEEEKEVAEEEEDADVFVDLETQEEVENELKGEADKEREDGETEIQEEKEEEEQEKEEEDLVIVEEEKCEQDVIIEEISSEAKEEDGGQLLDKIKPSELLLDERKDKGEDTEEEEEEEEKEKQGEESFSQINVSPASEDAAPLTSTSLEKEEECEDHRLDKEEPPQSIRQREAEEKAETGDSHQAVSLLAHHEEVAADRGGAGGEEEEDKSLSNNLQLQEFRGDEKKRDKKQERKRETERDEEKEAGEAPLPDCLLLMMYEPKLSMEVSKETWVCSRDFLWHRPRRQDRKKQQDKGAEEEKTKKQEEGETKKRVSFEERPQKKSPSMAKLIEQKLVNAYEPFVLTRCKSEPMRSTSSVSLVPETCFWKTKKLYRPYLGMGF